MKNFYSELKKGFFGLSPMDGVSDHAFRHIQKRHGRPAVVYTEFTSVEGLAHNAVQLLKDFTFDSTQRPIVAQVYGHTPKDFRNVTILVRQLGFDGIDINMGCPAKNVVHSGSGAALIKTPKLAIEIVNQVKAGILDYQNGTRVSDLEFSAQIKNEVEKSAHPQTSHENFPLSIKTRIGYDSIVTKDWISQLLTTQPAAITIHGRTLKQAYSGQANWQEIALAKELSQGSQTLIIGNGDVKNLNDGKQKIADSKVDGVLIGRASIGNPWIFKDYNPQVQDRLDVALEHSEFYEKWLKDSPRYSFKTMLKHLFAYLSNFDGSKKLRESILKVDSSAELETVFDSFINT